MDYREILFLVGRLMLGVYLVKSAWGHLAHSSAMAGYAASKGVPAPKAAVIVSGVLLLAGGLSILTGRYVEYGLWCVVAFFVPVTLMMHQYWKAKDPMVKMSETINFWKNTALLGAILMLMSLPMVWKYSL